MLVVCSQSSSNRTILSPRIPLPPSPCTSSSGGRSDAILYAAGLQGEGTSTGELSLPHLPLLSLSTPSPPFPFSPPFLLLSRPLLSSSLPMCLSVCLSVCPSIHPAYQIAIDTTMTPSYMTAVEMLDDETFLGADSQHLFVCQKNKWVGGASGRDA